VIGTEGPTRQSLDSTRFPRMPRGAGDWKTGHPSPTVEESFEDVGLDDNKALNQQRKRGFFSKFSDSQEKDATTPSSMSRFHMPGRKRGQSGQGAELGVIPSPQVMVTSYDTR
jgi:hypothetical protein